MSNAKKGKKDEVQDKNEKQELNQQSQKYNLMLQVNM